MALAICGLVGAAVAAMLSAVAYGTSSRRELRGAVVRYRNVEERVSASVRSARAVLETGTDYVVLWMHDTRVNQTPDLSEIRMIERDTAAGNVLRAFQFPSNWTQAQIDAAEQYYTLSGNPAGYFRTQTTTAKTAGSFVPTLWASNVTALTVQANTSDPATTSLVSFRIDLKNGDLTHTLIGAASPRITTVN